MAERLCKWTNKERWIAQLAHSCTHTQQSTPASINDPHRDQIIFQQNIFQCHAILPLSGTFQLSLQSHRQYLVLMGNFGGSAMNEVWFPCSIHPHWRIRITKTFFPHYRDCLHQLFHWKIHFLLQIFYSSRSRQISLLWNSVWETTKFIIFCITYNKSYVELHTAEVFNVEWKIKMRTPQLFSVYFRMHVSGTEHVMLFSGTNREENVTKSEI